MFGRCKLSGQPAAVMLQICTADLHCKPTAVQLYKIVLQNIQWVNHYIVRKNSYCWWGGTCCNRQMKLQPCLLWGKSTRGDLFLQIILFFLVLWITWDVYFVNPPVEPISLHVRDRGSREMQLASQVKSWFLAHPPLIRAAVYLQLIQVFKGTSTANKRIGWHFPLTPSYFPLLLQTWYLSQASQAALV